MSSRGRSWALNRGPQLVIGRVKGDRVLGRIKRATGRPSGASSRQRQSGLVYWRGGGLGREGEAERRRIRRGGCHFLVSFLVIAPVVPFEQIHGARFGSRVWKRGSEKREHHKGVTIESREQAARENNNCLMASIRSETNSNCKNGDPEDSFGWSIGPKLRAALANNGCDTCCFWSFWSPIATSRWD